MNCSVWKVLDNRGRGWPGAAALQTRTGDAPIAPSSFIAMPLSQLVVRLFANHDRSESGTIETATALLPLPTLATLPISIRERARSIRVAPFDTTAEQHVIHVSFTFAIKQIGIFFIFIYFFIFLFILCLFIWFFICWANWIDKIEIFLLFAIFLSSSSFFSRVDGKYRTTSFFFFLIFFFIYRYWMLSMSMVLFFLWNFHQNGVLDFYVLNEG